MANCWECGTAFFRSDLMTCSRCNQFENCAACRDSHERNCRGACWRIRVKNRNIDRTRAAWDRNEIGVWFDRSSEVAIRLENIPESDWVLTYLKDHQALGIAKVKGPLRCEVNHPLNIEKEVFSYRKIYRKRIYRLSDLPDVYRILPSQGRATVYLLRATWHLTQLLIASPNTVAVKKALSEMPFNDLLQFLGPSAWESFCFAYLIMEEGFIPTGLSIGRTLPDVDIVGRRRRDGRRIIAQCKKDDKPRDIDQRFRVAVSPGDIAYYFAFGGCSAKVPKGISVIDRAAAINWSKTSANGRCFRRLLLNK